MSSLSSSSSPTSSSRRNGGYVPNKLRGVQSSSSSSTSPSKQSAMSRLKGRKSRPWRADAATWKQNMRERKAVFQNFAVDEQDDENDDNNNDNNDVNNDEDHTSTNTNTMNNKNDNSNAEGNDHADNHPNNHQQQQPQLQLQQQPHSRRQYDHDNNGNDDDDDNVSVVSSVSLMSGMTLMSTGVIGTTTTKGATSVPTTTTSIEDDVEQYIHKMKHKEEMMKYPKQQQPQQHQQQQSFGYTTPKNSNSTSSVPGEDEDEDDEIMATRSPMPVSASSPEEEGDIPMMTSSKTTSSSSTSSSSFPWTEPIRTSPTKSEVTIDRKTSSDVVGRAADANGDHNEDGDDEDEDVSPVKHGGDVLMTALFGGLPTYNKKNKAQLLEQIHGTTTTTPSSSSNDELQSTTTTTSLNSTNVEISSHEQEDTSSKAQSQSPLNSMSRHLLDDEVLDCPPIRSSTTSTSSSTTSTTEPTNASHHHLGPSSSSSTTTSAGRPSLSIDTRRVNDDEYDDNDNELNHTQLDTPHPIPSVTNSTPFIEQRNDDASPPRPKPDPLQQARKNFVLSDLSRTLQNRPSNEVIIESYSTVVIDESLQQQSSSNTNPPEPVSSAFQTPIRAVVVDDIDDYDESGLLSTSTKEEEEEEVSSKSRRPLVESFDPRHSPTEKKQQDPLFDDIDDYDGNGVMMQQSTTIVPPSVHQDHSSTNIPLHGTGDDITSSTTTTKIHDLPKLPLINVTTDHTPTKRPSRELASKVSEGPSPMTMKKHQVMNDLTDRLQSVYTANHKCIEASGRAGPDGPSKPIPKELSLSERKTYESRGNVLNELNTRVASIYTDHHHVVVSPSMGKNDDADGDDIMKALPPTNESKKVDNVPVEIRRREKTVQSEQSKEHDVHGENKESGLPGSETMSTVVVASLNTATATTNNATTLLPTDQFLPEQNSGSILLEDTVIHDAPAAVSSSKRRESVKGKKWKDRLASKKASKIEKSNNVPSSAEQTVAVQPSLKETDVNQIVSKKVDPSIEIDEVPLQSPTSQSPVDTISPKNSGGKSGKWKARLAKLRGSNIPAIPAVDDSESSTPAAELGSPQPDTIDHSIKKSDGLTSQASATVPQQAVANPQSSQSHTYVVESSEKEPKVPDTSPFSAPPDVKAKDRAEVISQEQNESMPTSTTIGTRKGEQGSVRNDLHTSFSKFDQFLSARPGMGMAVDDESVYTEVTIDQEFTPPAAALPPKTDLNYQPPHDEDEQSYMEYTVDESVQASYMEETVYSEYTMGPVGAPSNQLGNHGMTPHMSNLLSSRMFQDVGAPLSSHAFEPSTDHVDEQSKRFPTIHVQSAGDDDDMTQITMDHGLHEMESDDHDDDSQTSHEEMVLPQPLPVISQTVDQPIPHSGGLPPPAPVHESKNLGRPPTAPFVEKSPSILSVKSSKSLKSSKSKHSNKSRRSQGDSSTKSQLSSESSKQRMNEILRKEIWNNNHDVVRSALEELSKEAAKGYKYRSHIIRLGGVMAVTRAMETHQGDEAIQGHCCKILGTLSLEPESQTLICEMEGVPLIVKAMQKFQDDVHVQEAACTALSSICRRHEIDASKSVLGDSNGAVLTLLIAMTKNPDNNLIRAKAFSAISNLCMESKDQLSELAEAGGIMTLTMALQKPWADMNAQHEAISNLSILLRGVAELNSGPDAQKSVTGQATGTTEPMNENDESNSSLETQEEYVGDTDTLSSNGNDEEKRNIVAVDSDLDYAAAELESLPRVSGTPKNEGTSRTSSNVSISSATESNAQAHPSDDPAVSTRGSGVMDALGLNSELEEMISKVTSQDEENGGKDTALETPLNSDESHETKPEEAGSWTPTHYVKHPQITGSIESIEKDDSQADVAKTSVDKAEDCNETQNKDVDDAIGEDEKDVEMNMSMDTVDSGDEKCAIQ